MTTTRSVRAAVLSVALLLPAAVAGPSAASSQGEQFAPPPASTPLPARVLFLPLAEQFDDCLPLRAACPEGSSSMVVVPAEGRRIAWSPEGGELPEASVETGPVGALGSPPPDPAGARYLVPVVDGRGAGLVFAARRLAGAELVPGEAAPAPGDDAVPVLVGPLLGGEPAGDPVDRLFDEPSVVDAAELTDAVPVLFVRRAAPSRVAFGVQPDPEWGLDAAYVPLLDRDVVAALARHDGDVGLAVPAPPPGDDGDGGGSVPDDDQPGDDGDDSGDGGEGATLAVPIAIAIALAVGIAFRAWRRRRRR